MADYSAKIQLIVEGQQKLKTLQQQVSSLQKQIKELTRLDVGGVFEAEPLRSAVAGLRQEKEKLSKSTKSNISLQQQSNKNIERQLINQIKLNAAVDLYDRRLKQVERSNAATQQQFSGRIEEIGKAFKFFKDKGSVSGVRAVATELGRIVEYENEILLTERKREANAARSRKYAKELNLLELQGLNTQRAREKFQKFASVADTNKIKQAAIYQDALENQLRVLREQVKENLRLAKVAPSSPVRGGAAFPGSPKFLQTQRKNFTERISNIALGAGFPLLFGGGPGAVLGGAAGGLVGGPGAFAAQIGLSAIGQQLDMFAASATKVGIALSPLTADVDAVIQALGITGTATANYIAELQKLERQDEALAVATEEMARLVGDRGVQALRSFGEAATELSNEWARAMTQMQAALAGLLAGPLRAVVNQLESANLFRQAQASSDPRIQQLIQLRNRPGILGGTGDRSINDITAEIIELQRKANVEAQKREQIETTTAGTLTQQKRVLEAQLELAYTDGDLTNDKVFKLSQILIDKEFEVKLQQAINDKTDVELVQLDRKVKLQQLAARREQAMAAAAAKAASELERQRKEMERMAELRRKQLDDAQRSFILAEAEIDIATSNTKESKLQAEYDKVRVERMFTFTDLLKKALSEEEREFIVQTQYLQAVLDTIKNEEALLDLKKQQTAELYAQLDAAGILDEQTQKRLRRGMSRDGGADRRIGILGFTSGLDLDPNNKATQKMNEMKQRLEELSDPINMAAQGAIGIGNAFNTAFQGIITGTQSTQEALSNFFKGVGDAFVSMASEIIAQMVVMFAFKQLLGLFGGNSGGLFSGAGPVKLPGALNPLGGADVAGNFAPNFTFAEGGFVTGPTNALIGEGGEPEYVIPQSKMSAAMSRYSRGARGSSVIPGNGDSAESATGTMATTSEIDVRYTVERINSVDYVTADQFQAGMQRAAQQGAALGKQQVYSELTNKRSLRTRLAV